MSTNYEFTAELRQDIGKGASRRLRHQEKVPGILYGTGKKSQAVVFEHKLLAKLLEDESNFSKILTLKIDKKSQPVLIKALQRHHFKPKFMHIDLLRVSLKEKLTTNVPFVFIGEETAPGVKDDEGIISYLKNEIEVQCLPADLPENIEIDLSALEVGQSFVLSELKLPKVVELTHTPEAGSDEDHPIASITMAKEEPEVEATTEEGDESTEESKDDSEKSADSPTEDKQDKKE